MDVFKVLIRDGQELLSPGQFHQHIFRPDETTISVRAPIFVFTDETWAKIYAKNYMVMGERVEVWVCTAKEATPISRIIHTMEPRLTDPDAVEEWWAGNLELKTMPAQIKTAYVRGLVPYRKLK